jgi:hypothetical protein
MKFKILQKLNKHDGASCFPCASPKQDFTTIHIQTILTALALSEESALVLNSNQS